MNALYFLIPISLIIGLGLVFLLMAGIKNNQFDDLQGGSERLIFEDCDDG